jgi:hypothetical protein
VKEALEGKSLRLIGPDETILDQGPCLAIGPEGILLDGELVLALWPWHRVSLRRVAGRRFLMPGKADVQGWADQFASAYSSTRALRRGVWRMARVAGLLEARNPPPTTFGTGSPDTSIPLM